MKKLNDLAHLMNLKKKWFGTPEYFIQVSSLSTTPTRLKEDEYIEGGRVPLELKVQSVWCALESL